MAWYNGDDTTLSTHTKSTPSETYSDSVAVGPSFGSPAFIYGGDSNDHTVESMEVKLIHRFRVRFGVFKNVGHHIKTITKPNVTFAEVEVPKLNSKVYFAGRKTQDSMTIELDDALDGGVTRGVQTQLQKQANFDTNLHAKSSDRYFFNIVSDEVTGDGTLLMAWYYDRCVVMTCDFGTLDYSDDAGTASINLGIRYSNFTIHVPAWSYDKGVSTESYGTPGSSTVSHTQADVF